MKGFRTRISRKDSSTPPPGSPAKKPSPLAPVRSGSASSEASPISIRLARGSADSAVSGSPSASASSNRTPRRTASRSSTASVSSLSGPAPAPASRRAGASSAPDASTTRDPAPASRQLKEPTDPVLPQARPKDKDAAPSEQASTTSASVPKADQASVASSTKADPPPTPPSSPPPPPVMPAPIPRSMSPPLTIDTNGVPRRGSEEQAKAKDDESFVHLTESEHATADSADAPPLQLQMPEPQTTTAHAQEGTTNPFLDQPETPNSIDVQHLAMPQPRAANGKSVSFSQTVQEISPLTDYAPSAIPSPSSDQATAASSAPAGATWSWTEHVLPDTTYYYSLPAARSPTRCTVVTDMDLRNAQRLRVVEAYLRTIPPIAYPSPPMPHTPTSPFTFSFPANSSTASANPFAKQKTEEYESIEVYLRNVAPRSRQASGEFVPLTTYVRHGTRAVSMQPPFETREVLTDADRLDQEAQYWAFLEAHPAHAVLPPGARDDALEALTWSYTERVLESRNAARVGNAFSERECHELLALLRGLEGTKASSAIHTRLVAKVHLRLAQWRQQFVALGESGGYPPKHVQTFDVAEPPRTVRVPFRRSCARLVFGVLCLGIPYLFYSRSTSRSNTSDDQQDDERATTSGGMTPRAASSLVFSAAVCLIGAVMLSVSVTFLALPGLERLARALALLSAMCSLASLGASVLVMPRRAGSPITLTRARALPAVLLAYAVASFVGATVAYAAKGVVQRDPRAALEGFGAQTLWMVVAVWAVLAVVLAGAAWVLRGAGPRQAASRGGYRALPS